jgi:dihydroorotase
MERGDMRLLVCGGRVVDPAAGRDGVFDVLIEEGRVARIGERLEPEGMVERFDASGLIVCPGLIDLHVHLREPGEEYKETIASGARAAAAGGFTAVCAMANTRPVNDSRAVTDYIVGRAREAGASRVYPIGAITKGLEGRELAEFGEMRQAGAVAVSDDGRWVADGGLFRRALEYASLFDLPVVEHCQDPSIAGSGVMHEGAVSTRLGLRGQPAAAEECAVSRDLALAALTGGRLHVAHLSTLGSLERVREAKKRGVRVTCEVTPHHLFLTDSQVASSNFSTDAKMNPPLREESDVEGLAGGLADGTVDAIATDHAPHHPDEKATDFDSAPFGVVGLETAVSLLLDRLVRSGRIGIGRMIELLSAGPARCFGLPGGTLVEGGPADLTVLDLEKPVIVEPDAFQSLSRNTPFRGWRLTGAPAATIVDGRIVWPRS